MKYSLVTKERDLNMDEIKPSHQRKISEMLTIFPESIQTQISVNNITYTALFNAIVYHMHPSWSEKLCLLPLSSILLPSTNICCKAVRSLAFGFPSYWHHVPISRACVGFWGAVYGRMSFWLPSGSILPSTCCCGLDWKSSSLSACGNTSIHWSKSMKCRGKYSAFDFIVL